MNRAELEAAAHAKWERENLIKQAEAKWAGQNTPKEQPGAFEHAIERVDAYSGAPVRKFIGDLQDKKSIYESAKGAYHQIGKDAKTAPTPEDIVNKDQFIGEIVNSPSFRASYADTPMTWGPRGLLAPFVGGWEKSGELVGKAPKAAAIVGVGAATDPIAHVPVTPFVKPAQKAYGLLPEAIKSPLKTGGNIVASGAEYLTGVPKAAWKNYIENPQAIKALEEAHGPNVADAADSLRESWGAAIGQKKQTLGQIIDEALSAAPKKAKIDPAEIIGPLNEAKKNLNPNIKEHAAAIAQIDDHINQVRALAPEGKLTAKDAYDLQKTMQGRGRASYAKDGAMFNPAPESAKAARGAAAETRKIVNSLLPDVAKANEALSELHGIDDTMRASLYKPGTSNAGLMTTLSKTQTPEAQQLEALGRWIDRDVVQEAKDFATYKRFQGMGNDASDQTGKAVYRMIGGSILGGAAGGTSGDPMNALIGAGAGALSTNPKRIRNLIDAALSVKNRGAATFGKGGLLDKGAEQVRPFITALERRLNPTLEKGVKAAEDFILDEGGQFTPGQIKGFLKREGTYDLKKAREAAGPAKGLLPGEGGAPVGKYRPPLSKEERGDLLNWIDSAYNTLRRGERFSPIDEKYLREVLPVAPDYQKTYVKDLLEQIEKQKTGFNSGEEIVKNINDLASRTLDIRGLPKEDAAKVASAMDTVKNLKNNESLSPQQVRDALDHIHNELKALHEFRTNVTEQPRGLLTNLNVEKGPVRELPEAGRVAGEIRQTNSGVTGVRHPTDFDIDLRMVSVLKKQANQYGNLLPSDIAELKPILERAKKSNNAELVREVEGLLSTEVKTRSNMPDPAVEARKTAEAERLKKNVVSVDMKKAKAPKGQHVWANRKKPDNTPIDVPFGGSVTLNKATSNAAEVSPKKYHVLEALDDDSGYLVIDPVTQKTMEVSHSEISGVFNEKGKPVKPKSKPTKPKGKK